MKTATHIFSFLFLLCLGIGICNTLDCNTKNVSTEEIAQNSETQDEQEHFNDVLIGPAGLFAWHKVLSVQIVRAPLSPNYKNHKPFYASPPPES
ncbi:hypothetical protein BCY91_14255 [Pelobium manganitolerans]|uniref:Uncharacterized protein n=1 Tax=Pelobium manganitolerans TaxID=1842495 RepID=A0A419SAF1_9SPHI|nr:hypothetical protein BCY91_14255 [Pelobium manganitolerans]